MKRFISIFLISLFPAVLLAEDVVVEGFWLDIDENSGTASLIKGDYHGDIIIPESILYGGIKYTITEIDRYAFSNSDITSVVCPNSIINIGNAAFWQCKNLISVVLSENITNIEQQVFEECKNLTSINIPDGVKSIGYLAFADCEKLKFVKFPKDLVTIGQNAFGGTAIEEAVLYDKLETIGRTAFVNCLQLKNIKMPKSVKKIGEFAFNLCSNLQTIELQSDPIIGECAFKNCTGLKEFYCNSIIVPTAYTNAFEGSNITNAKLYVPERCINDYKSKVPWNGFGTIVSISGGDDHGERLKCEKPTIFYNKGKLNFQSSTDGVTFYYTIKNNDTQFCQGDNVELSVTYLINVYATKTGYIDSETATATLCWIDVEPKKEGFTNGISYVRSHGVVIQASEGFFNISGAEDGTPISVYNTAGQMVGSVKASSETTIVNTMLQEGEIGIVKIGDKSIKVLMK